MSFVAHERRVGGMRFQKNLGYGRGGKKILCCASKMPSIVDRSQAQLHCLQCICGPCEV